MYAVIDFVLKNLFENQYVTESGETCTYVTFRSDDDHDWIDGVNAALMFGRVEYLHNGVTFLWKPMLLKLTPQVINFPQFHVYRFINEAFFYTRVLPAFDKLRSIRHLFPKFYTSYVEMNENDDKYLLVLENLKAYGYLQPREKSFLNYEHLKMMMRKLGEFHAYSYKAKKANIANFFPLVTSSREVHFTNIEELQNLWVNTSRGVDILRTDSKYASKLENFEKIKKNVKNFINELLTGETRNPVSVLCHGNYSSSNILFKYENGKLVDLKIIDLVSFKFTSPVVDLSLVLYLNADQQMRDKHWDDLINEYYESLSETFVGEVPSKEAILNEFKTKSLFAYFVASYFLVRTINSDLKLPNFKEFVPMKYREYAYSDLPVDLHVSFLQKAGGPKATEALANILKDIIDRGFI